MSHRVRLRRGSLPPAAALLLSLAAGEASGQTAEPPAAPPPRLTFGVAGGVAQSPPFYNFGSASGTGYAARANLELRTPVPFLQLRGEGLVAGWSGGQRVGALTASAVAAPAVRWRAVPYVLGGGGGYALASAGGLRPGWTVGAGLRVPVGRQAFVLETGMHVIDTGERAALANFSPAPGRWQYTYTPVTVGWRF